MYIMTELENLMSCFLWTQLNAYFSPSSLPNLSEEQNFSAANTNMVLNFPKLENLILVWKAFNVRDQVPAVLLYFDPQYISILIV